MHPLLSRARFKNSRLRYHLANAVRVAMPRIVHQVRREGLLARLPRGAALDDLRRRVEYAYRCPDSFSPGAQARVPGLDLLRSRRNYAYDLLQYARCFPAGLRLAFRFGDETSDPGAPTLVKAREVGEASGHSILFPLNKVRHFVFVNDPLPFAAKRDHLVWRGAAVRSWRRNFLQRAFGRPCCDVGCTDARPENAAWRRPYLGIREQLQYKFVLSIEGIDVATNLKWILSSNSLCFMVPPRKESWFLEGQLVPGEHYVALREDYADLEEQMARHARDGAAAQRILRAAHAHVDRFRDPVREDQAALLVLLRYFHDSGQWPAGAPGSDLLADLGWASERRPARRAYPGHGRGLPAGAGA